MIVMKFGGTSTQDAAAMSNVVRIIKARLHLHPIIVVSAIAQATNTLETAGRLASEGKHDTARDLLRALIERHIVIVEKLIRDPGHGKSLLEEIRLASNQLEELVHGVHVLRELTPRTMDAFYCFGELLSSRIVAAALQDEGIDAQWVDTKDFMVTDENFTRAAPMMEMVEKRLQAIVHPSSRQFKVYVTQGFIGVTSDGRRTTMGRESSDYSAAVIGAALNVGDIQIWTDVDGVLTADPHVVNCPQKVKVLSFDEAYELSFFGAKVLHPNTMLPAIEKRIPIHVYNSRRPNSSGTLITNESLRSVGMIKSVAYRRDVVIMSVRPRTRYSQYGFWEQIFNVMTKNGANAYLTVSSEQDIAVALDARNTVEAIQHEISFLGDVSLLKKKAILSLVGTEIRSVPDLLSRMFSALKGMRTELVSFGASGSSLSIVVDDDTITDAVRGAHEAFFSEPLRTEVFESLEIKSTV